MPKMAINRQNEEKQKSVVSPFLFKSFHIRRLQKQIFFPIPSLYFEGYSTMPMSYFELDPVGLIWLLTLLT